MAVMLQVPIASSVTSAPAAIPAGFTARLQMVGVVVVKVTGRPEVAVAVTVKAGADGLAVPSVPSGWALKVAKVMVWAVLLTVKLRVMVGAWA